MPPTPEDSVELDEAERRYAMITDDAVDSLRRLIGVPIVDTVEPWCYEATRDNIRHYAHGIGDDNPLWCDPAYAAQAPVRHDHRPAELRVRPRPRPVGLRRRPPRHPRHVGRRRPHLARARSAAGPRSAPRPTSRTSSSTRPASPGGRSSRSTTSTSPTTDGTLLVQRRLVVLPHRARHGARGRARSTTKPTARPPTRYSDEDLREIYDLYEAEPVRGAEPRYVEDVAVGDELAADGQGADDRHRLHRLRPGLGRPLHPGQQAGLRAAAQAPRASASPTPSASPTCPSGCTGRTTWPPTSARPAPTTTGPSGARG